MPQEGRLPTYPEATLEQLLAAYSEKKAAVDQLLAETERLGAPIHHRALQASLVGLETCTSHIAERLSREHKEPDALLIALTITCQIDGNTAQAAIDNIPKIRFQIADWRHQQSS